jgi:hypothetical protein
MSAESSLRAYANDLRARARLNKEERNRKKPLERNGSQSSSRCPVLGTEEAGKEEQATTTKPVPERAEQRYHKPKEDASAPVPTPSAQQPSAPANASPEKYRSDRDELVALIAESVGQVPDNRLVWDIQRYIEIRVGSLREYLDDIRPRLGRLRKRPMFGFFLWHAQNWNSSASREAAPPSTLQEQAGTKQCGCVAGRLAEGYCTCAMGKDLSRVEKRLAREAAAAAPGANGAR